MNGNTDVDGLRAAIAQVHTLDLRVGVPFGDVSTLQIHVVVTLACMVSTCFMGRLDTGVARCLTNM